MSSARTPRHSAGDALPAPPRAPARKHTRTRGAHTQGLTNTNTRTHTRTRTPHGHTLVHAPADTPPPPPPSPRMLSRREAPRTRPRANARSWEHRGDGAPHTHTHTNITSSSPCRFPLPPQKCSPEWKQPAGGHPQACPVHAHTAVHDAPSTGTVPSLHHTDAGTRQGAVLPFLCASLLMPH